MGRGLNDKACHPCPDGYFSSKVNSPCQKWTNCTENGQKVLKGGSQTQDMVCSDLPVKTVPVGVTLSVSHKTSPRGPSRGPRSQNSSAGGSHRTSQSPTRDDVNSQIRSTSPAVTQSSETSWTTVRSATKEKPQLRTPFPSLLFLVLSVLAVIFIIYIILAWPRIKKIKKHLRQGKNSHLAVRIPVQEEDEGGRSSIVKN
ncbi:tumor necrosis factor receptor superfamily member 4-like [Erpetoichthys calabaricus]|uniref:tumor necrosis factor receptor superfamily member 4-like n=1 Tax=Erpetoichthys calabaricus TaxID=27687 RepID=UPI0022345AF3|nr:tumor necrosis factor receptor superfamily member 4-like [Erpetoichthys calabaricus]